MVLASSLCLQHPPAPATIHLTPRAPARRKAIALPPRTSTLKRTPWLAFAVVCVITGSGAAADKAGEALTYEQQIRPIFKAMCFPCHGEGDKLKGGLDLRLRRLTVQGGDSGPALVPGRRDDS